MSPEVAQWQAGIFFSSVLWWSEWEKKQFGALVAPHIPGFTAPAVDVRQPLDKHLIPFLSWMSHLHQDARKRAQHLTILLRQGQHKQANLTTFYHSACSFHSVSPFCHSEGLISACVFISGPSAVPLTGGEGDHIISQVSILLSSKF